MPDSAGAPAQDGLPSWAVVSPERAAHVERVVALLDRWAAEMHVTDAEARRWRRAGWLHDAFRDADEALLRHWASDVVGPLALLHGPAAARRAAQEGERDEGVLAAVRWHTTGTPDWGRAGEVLYAADFLEPGRPFARQERAQMVEEFPDNSRAVLRRIVELRLDHQRGKGRPDLPLTIAFREALGR